MRVVRRILFLTALACVSSVHPATSQEAAEPGTTPPSALSATAVEQIDMGRKVWRPADPEKNTGVRMKIRLGPGAFSTEEFALSYKAGEKMVKGKKTPMMGKVVCRGYQAGRGAWAITDEEGKGFRLFTGNPVTDIDFLFEVPKGTAEVTLLYKDKPTGEPVPLSSGISE